MWMVVYIAEGIDSADLLRRLLESEGILAKVRRIYKNKTEAENSYEIMVLESETEEAREIMALKGF